MSNKDLETILRERLKPTEFQREFARDFILSPIHLGIFLGFLLAKMTGLVPREFSQVSVWINTPIYIAVVTVYFGFIYLVYPHSMRFCAVKRIPFVVHCYAIYLVFIIMYALALGDVVSQYSDMTTQKRFFNNVVLAIPFVVLLAIVKGEEASISLFDDANLYPPWHRYRPPEYSIFLKISPELVSPIRYIEAESPYVKIVTTNGTERLRMAFKDAVSAVSPDSGWKVHRSIWVAKSELANLKYIDGNPKVILKDGTVLNASRGFADFVHKNMDDIIHSQDLNAP